jgi:O-antigen ligase
VKWLSKSCEWLFYIFFASLIFSNTLAQGVAILLIFFWITRWIFTKEFIKNPLDLPVIIYLIVRMISCFTSVDVMVSFHELRSGIFFSLIYFAITNMLEPKRSKTLVYRFVTIMIYAGVVASLYGSVYVIVNHFTVKARSTAGGVTRFAEYSMIVFCFAFVLAREKKVFFTRYIAFAVLGIIGLGLIFSQERAQWLGVVPAVLVIGIKRERYLLSYILILVALLILTIKRLRERLLTLLHPFVHTTGRLTIWKGAMSAIKRRPVLGFGPRTYSIVSPVLKDRGSYHCDYLQVYMDSGIFGFISYIYLSIMLFRQCIQICRKDSKRNLGNAILFALIAMYIVSFFSGHTREPVITPLFFSLIGFVSVLSKHNQ